MYLGLDRLDLCLVYTHTHTYICIYIYMCKYMDLLVYIYACIEICDMNIYREHISKYICFLDVGSLEAPWSRLP